MQTLSYAYLIDRFRLPVLRQTPVARLSTVVNRRVDGETEILFLGCFFYAFYRRVGL